MKCCRSVLDCWYLWRHQQRRCDEQLGPLQEVFVLRKEFYLSATKSGLCGCAHDLYILVHKTSIRAPFSRWMEAMLDCIVPLELFKDKATCSLHQLCSDGYLTRSRWSLETDRLCSEFQTGDHDRKKGGKKNYPCCKEVLATVPLVAAVCSESSDPVLS